MRIKLMAMLFALTATIGSLEASERFELRQVAELVTYHPKTLNGCGLLLDLAAVDRSATLSLEDKLSLIAPVASSDGDKKWDALQQDEKYEPFFKLVRIQAKLGEHPATQGELLQCTVTSLSGQAVAGGFLVTTSLTTDEGVKAGQAAGFVEAAADSPTGKLVGGVRLKASLHRSIVHDGRVVIRLKEQYAGEIQVSNVTDIIRQMYRDQLISHQDHRSFDEYLVQAAFAIDASRISVEVPAVYAIDPYGFAAQLMELSIYGLGHQEIASVKETAELKLK